MSSSAYGSSIPCIVATQPSTSHTCDTCTSVNVVAVTARVNMTLLRIVNQIDSRSWLIFNELWISSLLFSRTTLQMGRDRKRLRDGQQLPKHAAVLPPVTARHPPRHPDARQRRLRRIRSRWTVSTNTVRFLNFSSPSYIPLPSSRGC